MPDERRDVTLATFARKIAEAVENARSGSDVLVLSEYETQGSGNHEVLVFLKPEVTAPGVDIAGVLAVVSRAMDDWGLALGALRVIPAAHLADDQTIEAHYGVINRIAREGRPALSHEADRVLERVFADDLAQAAPVLGAYEALAEYPDMSARELADRVDDAGSTKLAGGTYAARIEFLGATHIVLNGFHPAQVEHYTALGRVLVAFQATTHTDWMKIRQNFTGATDPSRAAAGSVRQVLHEQHARLRIDKVDQGSNCIHCSAGPVEGMSEVARFLEVPLAQTSFGRRLADSGVPANQIELLTQNPLLEPATTMPAFDATEEKNAGEAVELITVWARDGGR